MAAAVLLTTVVVAGAPVARAFGGPEAVARPTTYVIRSGDTLWSIAERHAPSEDPRAVIHDIARLNGLDGEPLVPGRPLQLPA